MLDIDMQWQRVVLGGVRKHSLRATFCCVDDLLAAFLNEEARLEDDANP